MTTTNQVASVLEDLIETLEDGRKGFEQAAEKLRDDGHPDIAETMASFSSQRGQFSAELRMAANTMGHQIKEEGSAAGALHRGWMTLKDALTGDDAHAILSAAETGEDHAVSEYRDALSKQLPGDLEGIISRQAIEVENAHDTVRTLRDRTES